jgi:hypothetical protein
LCCFNKFVDHGGRWGNTAQALAQWRPGRSLSGDAPRVLLLHRHGNHNCQRFAFIFVIADFIVAHNSS